MKIRIALIDSDDLYLQRFVSTFNSKYFDKITIFSFSDPAIAESNMQMSKYDIVIAAENFDLTPFKDRCAVAYFSNSNEINELNGEKAIGKYQRVENIYKQILDLYSEIHKGIIYNDNGGDNGTKIIGVFLPVAEQVRHLSLRLMRELWQQEAKACFILTLRKTTATTFSRARVSRSHLAMLFTLSRARTQILD